MRGEGFHAPARPHVPESHCFIVGARGDDGAARGKRHGIDGVVVAAEDGELACGGDVVEADGFVVGGGGEGEGVGGPGEVGYAGEVRGEGGFVEAGGGVPEFEGFIGRWEEEGRLGWSGGGACGGGTSGRKVATAW